MNNKHSSTNASQNKAHKLAIDLKDQKIAKLLEELEEANNARAELKATIAEFEAKVITMEEEIFEMESTQLELVNNLKDLEIANQLAEEKIAQLIQANEDLEKGQAIYIGHKEDKIDRTLGNYLNSYPERNNLRIMFLRESEGVYQFG
jgi:chromosome segregation ATPase